MYKTEKYITRLERKITQLESDLRDSSAEIVLCHGEIENLKTERGALIISIQLLLDQVDYTAGNCRVNEMVGAVLPKEIIGIARNAIEGGE